MNYIYVLKHPITKEIRYVGKTIDLKRRLTHHIQFCNKGKRTHCKSWIKSLLKHNLKPIIYVVERCTNKWQRRERYWIKFYTELGCDLCNHTIGGECGKISIDHILLRYRQILNALSLIHDGIGVIEAEKRAALPGGFCI